MDQEYFIKWALDCARVQHRELRRYANLVTVPYDWCPILSSALDRWYPAYCASRMSTMYQAAMMATGGHQTQAIELESASAWNEVIFLLGDYVPRRFDEQQARKGNSNGRL